MSRQLQQPFELCQVLQCGLPLVQLLKQVFKCGPAACFITARMRRTLLLLLPPGVSITPAPDALLTVTLLLLLLLLLLML
jgi:hypothetical protein